MYPLNLPFLNSSKVIHVFSLFDWKALSKWSAVASVFSLLLRAHVRLCFLTGGMCIVGRLRSFVAFHNE
jgi:hypothetical protein